MASALIKPTRRVRRFLVTIAPLIVAVVLLMCASAVFAHPMPESQVWIDTTPTGLRLTAQLPLNRLEFGFGHNLADHPDTVLDRYEDALAAYLLVHVGARSDGLGWQVLRPALRVNYDPADRGAAELEATFELRAPQGAAARAPLLLYDVITHEVRTHRVQVFLRNDWHGGFAGAPPQLLGELSYGHNSVFVPLRHAGRGASLLALFGDGLRHIAAGTDHLLFLLMLLLVAPLVALDGRWQAVRTPHAALRHTALVVTAFMLGHTLTLVLGSTGLVRIPAQPIEVAVALTIALAALHAWRPLFARAETTMALCFGLVHGMAFSATLSGAGLSAWQHAQALLAFNVGIEAMQMIALAAVLPPLLVLGALRPAVYARLRVGLAALAGLMACAWMARRLGLVDIDGAAWLGDGGVAPVVLVGVLWLAALACLAVGPARIEGAAAARS